MGRGFISGRGRGPFPPSAEASGTYAVLARLSPGYPPLRGRLPTCYSPVRRCTQDRSPFLARLACVRRAASVSSEPGSNPPLNWRSGPKSGEFTTRSSKDRSNDLHLLSSCQRATRSSRWPLRPGWECIHPRGACQAFFSAFFWSGTADTQSRSHPGDRLPPNRFSSAPGFPAGGEADLYAPPLRVSTFFFRPAQLFLRHASEAQSRPVRRPSR